MTRKQAIKYRLQGLFVAVCLVAAAFFLVPVFVVPHAVDDPVSATAAGALCVVVALGALVASPDERDRRGVE